MNQECPPDQQPDQVTTALIAPEILEEDWEDELTLPSGTLDWEQIIDQATTTQGGEANEGEHQDGAEEGEAAAWVGPKTSPDNR